MNELPESYLRLVEDAAKAYDHYTEDELEEFAATYNLPAEDKHRGARLLLEVPTEVKYIEPTHAGIPVIQCVLILPRHARVTDLNRYAVNPGDGKSYRIFEAEELRQLYESGMTPGLYTHAQYRVKGVQVYP